MNFVQSEVQNIIDNGILKSKVIATQLSLVRIFRLEAEFKSQFYITVELKVSVFTINHKHSSKNVIICNNKKINNVWTAHIINSLIRAKQTCYITYKSSTNVLMTFLIQQCTHVYLGNVHI